MLILENSGKNYKVYRYTDEVSIKLLKKQLQKELDIEELNVNLYETTKTIIVTWTKKEL